MGDSHRMAGTMRRISGSVLCAAIALSSGCTLLQSVDRGLYSIVEGVTERDRITGQRSLSLQDRAAQIQEGNRAAEQFLAEAKASGKRLNADHNPAAYARIQRIFSRLHRVSHLRDEQWTPVLVGEDAWNAFTTGGTYFVVFSGLEEDLKDDAELANVIAHEMAHTVANHAFERQSHAQLGALAGSKSARRGTFQAAFTHENEAEADRVAILYCALAGYDPHAGARIWERMYRQSGNNALWVQDHPMHSERAAQAQAVAGQVAKYYAPGRLHPDFLSILQSNEIFSQASGSGVEAGSGGGALSVLEAWLNATGQREQAKAEESRQQARIKFMQSIHRKSVVQSSSAISPRRWRVTVFYGGKRPLTDLSFKLLVKRNGAAPLEITRQISGVLHPNSTFDVDFESPELDAYRTSAGNVAFIYDNARAL